MRAEAEFPGVMQREREDDSGENRDRAKISGHGVPYVGAQKATPPTDFKTQFLFEFGAPVGKQIVAGIRSTFIRALAVSVAFRLRTLCPLYGPLSNLNFAVIRASRQILYCVTIIVAGREIHFFKVAAFSQRRVHEADALEKQMPIEFGRQP